MQHLPHVQRAADHAVASVAADIPAQGERLFRRLRLDHGGAFLHQIAHAERLRFELHLAALQLVHIQHVVDQFEQEAGSHHDLLPTFLLLGLVPDVMAGDFDHAANPVDRGADVVAHAAQKIRLGRVRASGLRDGLAKLALLLQLALLFGGAIPRRDENRRQIALLIPVLFEQAGAIPPA